MAILLTEIKGTYKTNWEIIAKFETEIITESPLTVAVKPKNES